MRRQPGPVALVLASLFASILAPAGALATGCLDKRSDGWGDPRTFDAFRACQARQRQDYVNAVKAKTGKAPAAAALEKFDDGQRADVTTYMSRHTIDGDDSSGDGGPSGQTASARQTPSGAQASAADASAGGQAGASQADLDALKRDMLEKSQGGKKGVTPDIAAEVQRFLAARQGGVSPDMQQLLDSTARDGVNLTPDTMKQLRNAGKQAKAQGMDLGIDPAVEKELLEGDLDQAASQPGTN